jgi:hypothetical protein
VEALTCIKDREAAESRLQHIVEDKESVESFARPTPRLHPPTCGILPSRPCKTPTPLPPHGSSAASLPLFHHRTAPARSPRRRGGRAPAFAISSRKLRRRHQSGGGWPRSLFPTTSTTPAASTTPHHLGNGRSGGAPGVDY